MDYTITLNEDKIRIVVPHLDKGNEENIIPRQEELLRAFFKAEHIAEYIFWYYTPMALHIYPKIRPFSAADRICLHG
jgi:hypothetical protein